MATFRKRKWSDLKVGALLVATTSTATVLCRYEKVSCTKFRRVKDYQGNPDNGPPTTIINTSHDILEVIED